MPRATLEEGQTSSVTRSFASRRARPGSAGRRDAVPDPVGAQLVQAGPDAGRPAAAHRHAEPTAARPGSRCGRPARTRPVAPRRSSLLSPNPITPRPAYCAASRASVRASSGCLVRLAAMMTPMPTPGRGAGLRRRVEHEFHGGGEPAEPGRVAGRVDLDFQPARAVGRLVLRGLAQQPADVGLGGAVPTARCRTAAGTGTSPAPRWPSAQPYRPVAGQRRGQLDPVLAGQLHQRRMPHRAGQVQVQVRLGERAERPFHRPSVHRHGRPCRHAPAG